MLRNTTHPHIFSQDNEDGTQEVVIGDFNPFNVIVVSNGNASVIPAECGRYESHDYYSYADILPSEAEVDAVR